MSALDVVRGGKHSGSTYAAVADTDRGYCHWIVNVTALPRSLRPFRAWVRHTHGGVLCFGKHRNSFYSEIYRDFPECPAIGASLVCLLDAPFERCGVNRCDCWVYDLGV